MASKIAPELSIEKITPRIAEKYLELNIAHNRKVRPSKVSAYALEMQRKQWCLTGETIKFDLDGHLFDGQHRLAAIVKSGVTVEMAVMRNAPANAFDVVDSGLKRTDSDNLRRLGIANATLVASVARLVVAHDAGLSLLSNNNLSLVTRKDIVDVVLDNAEIFEAASRMGRALDDVIGGNGTAWSFLFFIALREAAKDKPLFSVEDVQDFYSGIHSGEDLKAGDPRLAIRNWCSSNRSNSAVKRLTNIPVFIKTFNAYLTNTPVRRVMPHGVDQPFPILVKAKRKARA